MNKKRVYLFGAGASHSYNGSINKVNPPLARDFFKVFNKLKISEDLLVRVGHIINYVAKNRNLNVEKFNVWNEDIEEFLTEVDNKIISKLKNSNDKMLDSELMLDIKTYDQMIFLFTSVINEIQNGLVCNNYLNIVKKLNEGDTLITFNWDTLLDRALFESGIWNMEDGYNIDFKGIFRDKWIESNNDIESKVKLLKLHGSTNWLMPYYSVDIDKGKRAFANRNISEKEHPIFCFHYNTNAYETYDNRSFNNRKYTPFSYYYYPPNLPLQEYSNQKNEFLIGLSPDVGNYGKVQNGYNIKYSMPFIIPPVKYKNYGLIDGVLNSLWDTAENSISECDELIIIGYSFPRTDTKAWDLLKSSFEKRDKYPRLIIVDPYPEGIAERIAKEFSKLSDVQIYPITFDIFVEQYIDN